MKKVLGRSDDNIKIQLEKKKDSEGEEWFELWILKNFLDLWKQYLFLTCFSRRAQLNVVSSCKEMAYRLPFSILWHSQWLILRCSNMDGNGKRFLVHDVKTYKMEVQLHCILTSVPDLDKWSASVSLKFKMIRRKTSRKSKIPVKWSVFTSKIKIKFQCRSVCRGGFTNYSMLAVKFFIWHTQQTLFISNK